MKRKSKPSVPISVRVPHELTTAIDKRAEEVGGTRALVIHQALRAFFGLKHVPIGKTKRGGSNAPNPFD